jgi:recombination protein RecA
MSKPFDLSKFRKAITKSITGMSIGFRDPKTWISTGNYCLNYLISGDFFKGIPLGKLTIFAGISGSGKSYLASGNIVKNAQEQGIFVVLIDSENAIDESWLHKLGVDTSEDKLLKINMAMISDVAKLISEFIAQYRELPEDARPKVLFVLDSLGMLMAEAQVAQFNDGELKGDMGIKPKQLKALVTNCVNMFGDLDIGMVCTNHVYSSQDKYSDDIISGGSGAIFAASIIVTMNYFKLKEDEDGTKGSEVFGIRSKCKVVKSRYNKPFESVEIFIPYDAGMSIYSGLFNFVLKQNTIIKEGNRYVYTDNSGNQHKYWRKEYISNTDGILDLIMSEWDQSKILHKTEQDLIGADEDSNSDNN